MYMARVPLSKRGLLVDTDVEHDAGDLDGLTFLQLLRQCLKQPRRHGNRYNVPSSERAKEKESFE